MKKIIMGIIVLSTMALCIVFRNTLMAVVSVGFSKVTPIDRAYIVAREWSGEVSGIIRFDDGSFILKRDTIFREDNPIYIIKSLNKYFNEITLLNFKNNQKEVFLSTEELTK